MWADLSLHWQASVAQAWEAACAGTIPIGAVIEGPGGELLAAGRNRVFAPRETDDTYISGVRLAHAEINALLALEFNETLEARGIHPRDCTIYTTTEPCPMCAGAIVMANLRRVCFASRDPWAGSTSLYQFGYMGLKNMAVIGPTQPNLEDILIAIQVEYFLRKGPQRGISTQPGHAHSIFARLAEKLPRGDAFGRALFQNGLIERLQADNHPVSEVIDRLAEMLVEGTFSTVSSS